MKNFGLNELREMYLSFFETKGHLRLPSFSLIPRNDPSLLLINAGMSPMKTWFTGEEEPPSKEGQFLEILLKSQGKHRQNGAPRHLL